MAKFIPSLSDIFLATPNLSKGEHDFLKFCNAQLDDRYEVYYRPYLNGDRPQIIIMLQNYGAWVVEVFEGSEDEFHNLIRPELNYNNTNNHESIYYYKSPIEKVAEYRDNLINIHIEDLLEMGIYDNKFFDIVKCTVYCPNIHPYKLKEILNGIENNKTKNMLKYHVNVIGKDSLYSLNISNIISPASGCYPNPYFKKELYQNFKRLLNPTLHSIEMGYPVTYNSEQLDVITRISKEMRVKGVFGSGKTLTLAAKAINIYKRIKKEKTSPKILILTYNITLRNLILDKLQRVEDSFIIQDFIITNYHQFIKSELNNLNISINLRSKRYDINYDDYLNNSFYCNVDLFEKHKNKIIPYDAILIDEVQDYKYDWLNIVKKYFLKENGEYVLFGDVKQNIYVNTTENKDVRTNVRGKPVSLKRCYRADSKLRDLAILFQDTVFKDKYEKDELSIQNSNSNIFGDILKEGRIYYFSYNIGKQDNTSYIVSTIRKIILKIFKNIATNDIVILGSTMKFLQEIDFIYRKLSHEKTKTLFETIELSYFLKLNQIRKDMVQWHDELYKLLLNNLYYRYPTVNKFYSNHVHYEMSRLIPLLIYYEKYPSLLYKSLVVYCEKKKLSNINTILDFWNKYKNDIKINMTFNIDQWQIDRIRRTRKVNFNLNNGLTKIATIQSFKGLESRAVILLLEENMKDQGLNEILYTAITRAKENLVIFNIGNSKCHEILYPLVNKINQSSSFDWNNLADLNTETTI